MKHKLKFYFLISSILLMNLAFGQAPKKMSYQAVVRDASDNLIVNSSVGIQISVLQGSSNGLVVSTESQILTTNDNGLISLEVGSAGSGFDTISWNNGPYYIKTEFDPNGGSNYSITGSSELLSVPFALHSNTAGSIGGSSLNNSSCQTVRAGN
ncbi:MAG: collagen-like protein, partial [Flavobacteriales bacterium]|nr:collagen-like protein [Flavobacteriales bacterium]